jgi:tetrapyrrole methylase family protein / MazG family protein
MSPEGITILGLGPGDANLLTRQAWDWLSQVNEIYLRTRQHPAVAGLPANLKIQSFDGLYEGNDTFDAVYAQIVATVLELGRRPQGVTYAVPGHPLVAEATSPEIIRQAGLAGIKVQMIEGLSFLEPSFTALGIDPYPRLTLVDAMELADAHHPSFPPNAPVLVAQIYSRLVASEVKLTLEAVYPDEHPVQLVHAAGTPQERVESIHLYEIDRSPYLGVLSSLYVPPLSQGTAFEAFQEIVAHLRAPNGCPWDREQTHASLRTNLLEETYEALQALDSGNMHDLQEELGDLLLQIVLHSQIAYEEGEFRMEDVIDGIYTKIVRRHPHVFGDIQVDGVKGVLQNWEKLKAEERKAVGIEKTKGLLDGIPGILPSLSQAQGIQERAVRVGFDWPTIEPVWDKVMEELEEVRTAPDPDARAGELGDLLFAVVNLARWYKVDAETTLRLTNTRFRSRFSHIEKRARELGKTLPEMSLAEMDALWEEAKQLEQ